MRNIFNEGKSINEGEFLHFRYVTYRMFIKILVVNIVSVCQQVRQLSMYKRHSEEHLEHT